MTTPQLSSAADVLPSNARATLCAAARRIVSDAYADAESTAEFEASLGERIAALDAHSLSQLRRALGMLGSRAAMLLTHGVPLRFDALSAERQDSVLRSWERAGIGLQRTIFQAVRRLVVGSWYALPRAQRTTGYLGPYHLRGPRFPWEGPLPGTTRDDEPVLRGAVQPQLDLPLALRGVQDARTIDTHALSADVCVIGSGAGGGVVAARLAEAGFDVVLLEEGSYLAPAELDEDEGRMTARLYADGGARLTDDGAFGLLQGRTLGGGTTVNWMLMLEPPGHVMDEWENVHGAALLGHASLAPALEQVGEEVHARLVPPDAHDRGNRIILDGAASLGWKASAARINAKGCIRTGLCGLGCRYHAKQSTLAVYAPRAARAGARIVTNAHADRIEIRERGGRAPLKRVQATIADGSTRHALSIDAPIVVLAAGAIGTPALLQRSGLGGDGVGDWLRLHPTTAVAAVYPDVVYQAAGIPQSSLCTEYHDIDGGYGTWIECPPFLPALASVATPGFGDGHARKMKQFTHTAALIVLTRDGHDASRSNGRVRVRRDGSVSIAYTPGAHEWKLLRIGMRAAARIHLAAGATEVLTVHNEIPPLYAEADLDRIDTASMQPNRLSLFSAHVNGTCRMGTDRATSGCSPDAERWGVPGLYIADGSVLPTAPGINPQWTIMAAATAIAARIAERHRS